MLAQLTTELPDDIRVVYRHFPLASIHDKALLAAQASEAAGLQGKFWEMHDILYENQAVWSPLAVAEFETWLVTTAAPAIELDTDKFKADLTSENIVTYAQQTWEFGQQIGLPGTPFMVLNGSPYQGPLDAASMAAIIDLNKLKDLQFSECPPVVVDPLKRYEATI